MALTLESILHRCDEIGNCWLWKQGTNSDGQPNARDGSHSVPVRRRVWELKNGQPVGRGWFVVAACGQKRCVSPECASRLTGKQYMAWLAKHGKVNGGLMHSIARTLAVRARDTTKLDTQKAQDIRHRIKAGEDRGVVAAAYGITRAHANRVARGEQWFDITQSFVFNLAHSA